MKNAFAIVLCMLCAPMGNAQTITIALPKCAGQAYVWVLNMGTRQDTVLTGQLDAAGKARIVMPASAQGYRGLASFRMAQGGGLDLIVNAEDFTASSNAEKPGLDNMVFTHSPENTFLISAFKVQDNIKKRQELLQHLLSFYKPEAPFYQQATNELKKVTQAKAAQLALLKKSPLYAARFLEMGNYIDELGSYRSKSTLDLAALQHGAISHINPDLFTSSLWVYTLQAWSAVYRETVKNDSIFVHDALTLLRENQASEKVLDELGNNLVLICEQNGWDAAKMKIAFTLSRSGMLPEPTGSLAQLIKGFSASTGNVAPDITLYKDVKLSSLSAAGYIVIFYETGCGHCDDELTWLRQHYSQLEGQGYQVISIASDLLPEINAVSKESFPWSANLCDFKGFQGDNFKNYGVIGTPTIFILDKDKKIKGKYARLSDAGLL